MCGHVTSAEPSTRPDWLSRTLTDRAGAGQSPVGGAPAGAGGAKARERECACASGGAFSGAVGGSRSASPEVSGAGPSIRCRVLGSGGGWLGVRLPREPRAGGGGSPSSFTSLRALVSLFPPSETFPPSSPRRPRLCPGRLAHLAASPPPLFPAPEGCCHRSPLQGKGSGGAAGPPRALDWVWEEGGFHAAGPVAWEKERGGNVVSLWFEPLRPELIRRLRAKRNS